MADYPTLKTLAQGTSERWRDPKMISLSRANTIKARLLSSVRKTDFSLKHHLDGADYDALKAFYDANRALTFTYTFQRLVGGTLVANIYTVIFGVNDIDMAIKANGYFECSVILHEV